MSEKRKRTLEVREFPGGKWYVVDVRSTGPPLHATVLDQVEGPFYTKREVMRAWSRLTRGR